ncbi:unnamed protein product [Rotaria sp. Silwood1]|nr:unnamed protein product [Rotaria sp. Silwood1]
MENNDITVGRRNLSTSSCTCHRPSPYNENQLWSLQKAFLYSFNLFIDKTYTLSHWSYGLTSVGSSLTHAQRTKMINYAKSDVMAVTYLIRPITEQWSFARTKESSIEEMFITFQSTRPPPLHQPKSKKKIKNINVQKLSKIFSSIKDSDYELISSDEEIYLNQLIEPVVNVHPPEDQINNDDIVQDAIRDLDDDVELQIEVPTTDVIVNDHNDAEAMSVNEEINPPEHQQQRVKKKRSLEAKQKKNRNRNVQLRSTRFKNYFTRPYYYKFKSKTIKKVLHHYGVQFRHTKFSYDQVVIGVKTDKARRCNKFWDGSTTIKERNGLYMQLEIMCYNCKSRSRLYLSPKMPAGGHHEINIRLGIGGTLCGLDRTGIMNLLDALNLPSPIQKHKYRETQEFILNYVEKAQEQSMITAVEEAVVEADGVRDLVASGDGAWLTQGHSSLHGIATLCSTTANRKVIDTNWCSETWTKTSGAKKKEMIHEMFCRFLSIYKIKYTSYIGDGDAKVHSFLTSNPPYPGVTIKELEDTNHIAKRIRLTSMRKCSNLEVTNRRKKRTTAAANNSCIESDDEMLFMLNDKNSVDITQDLIGLELTDDDTNTDYEPGEDD